MMYQEALLHYCSRVQRCPQSDLILVKLSTTRIAGFKTSLLRETRNFVKAVCAPSVLKAISFVGMHASNVEPSRLVHSILK